MVQVFSDIFCYFLSWDLFGNRKNVNGFRRGCVPHRSYDGLPFVLQSLKSSLGPNKNALGLLKKIIIIIQIQFGLHGTVKKVEILQLLISKDVLHFLDCSIIMEFHPIKVPMAMRNNQLLKFNSSSERTWSLVSLKLIW